MNGGTTARAAFRYQDWCALYVLLSAYDQDAFQHIICENEKLDFECWRFQKYEGYQVKLNPQGLTAKDVNEVLNFFAHRFEDNLNKSECIFFFTTKPQASISQLFEQLESKTLQPKSRHKTVEKYIASALRNLDSLPFSVTYKVFGKKEIENLVWGHAKTILEALFNEEKLDIFTCNTFLISLKDKIEKLSCLEDIEEKKIYKRDVLEVCRNIKSSLISADRKGGKQEKKIVELPDDPSYEVIIRKRPTTRELPAIRVIPPTSSDINDLNI